MGLDKKQRAEQKTLKDSRKRYERRTTKYNFNRYVDFGQYDELDKKETFRKRSATMEQD